MKNNAFSLLLHNAIVAKTISNSTLVKNFIAEHEPEDGGIDDQFENQTVQFIESFVKKGMKCSDATLNKLFQKATIPSQSIPVQKKTSSVYNGEA